MYIISLLYTIPSYSRAFVDKRISHQVQADVLGDDWKGYVFKITGGCDNDGFAMKQGILTTGRVRLLLKQGDSHFTCKRDGYRKRKSIRGCIVTPTLSVINLVVIKRGETDIKGLTDPESERPARFFPKRASKIRKLFQLEKKDDVTRYAISRVVKKTSKSGKVRRVRIAPKIQRLITPERLQMKRRHQNEIKTRMVASRKQAEEYNALIAIRRKQAAQERAAALQKKRSLSRKLSERKASVKA